MINETDLLLPRHSYRNKPIVGCRPEDTCCLFLTLCCLCLLAGVFFAYIVVHDLIRLHRYDQTYSSSQCELINCSSVLLNRTSQVEVNLLLQLKNQTFTSSVFLSPKKAEALCSQISHSLRCYYDRKDPARYCSVRPAPKPELHRTALGIILLFMFFPLLCCALCHWTYSLAHRLCPTQP